VLRRLNALAPHHANWANGAAPQAGGVEVDARLKRGGVSAFEPRGGLDPASHRHEHQQGLASIHSFPIKDAM
jgi:hypothetical protein